MDRVYKQGIPGVVKSLENLRDQFVGVDSKADWIRLRIEPLLEHARLLDQLIRSREFVRETARLRAGVGMFHADQVYFGDNIRGLRKVLTSEPKAALRRLPWPTCGFLSLLARHPCYAFPQ
jgi:hypothetical protein